MRIKSAFLALAIVPSALAFGVAPAETADCKIFDDGGTPDDDTDDVLTCTSTNYLSCEDTLDPAGKLHDITVPVNLIPDAPETSFTAAGGCGVPEVPLFSGTIQDTPYDFDIGGFVEGNVDTLTFELHDIHATQARQSGEMILSVRINLDGQSPFGAEDNTAVDGSVSSSPLTLDIPVEMVASSTGLSDGMFFTVTNLGDDLPALLEEGTGAFHQIAVTIGFDSLGSTGLQTPVWGAAEVPASITVNGETKGTVIDATTVG